MAPDTLRFKMDTNQLTNASYGSALFAFLGAFTLSDWGILISIILGVSTFFVNWYYKHKERSDRLSASQISPPVEKPYDHSI